MHMNVCTCTLAHIHAVEEELEVNKPEQVCLQEWRDDMGLHHCLLFLWLLLPILTRQMRSHFFAEWTRVSAPWEGVSGVFNVSRGGG